MRLTSRKRERRGSLVAHASGSCTRDLGLPSMDSLAFLERPRKGKPQPVYVLAGDEDFLKRQVARALRLWLLGEQDDGFGYSAHPGDKALWSAVHDELQTLP